MDNSVKLLTLNLRHDADRWPERLPLIIDQVRKENPEVIAFQEVALAIDQANIIASELNRADSGQIYQVLVEPKYGPEPKEGIAFLSRLKVVKHQRIDLPGEGDRVAQYIRVSKDSQLFDIVNTHLHHKPKDLETIRLEQVKRILNWMFDRQTGEFHWLLVGDLNATPSSETIKEVMKKLASAYSAVNNVEPDFTFPTPLVSEPTDWHVPRTIDYVFFDASIFQASEARLVFTESHREDSTLYPSDHFGLVVKISKR